MRVVFVQLGLQDADAVMFDAVEAARAASGDAVAEAAAGDIEGEPREEPEYGYDEYEM